MKIKFLSLNLHCGMEDDYEEKMHTIAHACAEEAPDIILFQECVQDIDQPIIEVVKNVDIRKGNLAYDINSMIFKLSQTNYDMYFDWGKYGFDVLEEGLCILSQYDIIDVESRYVSNMEDINNWKSRKIIRVKLKLDGTILYVYSIHLGWWDDGEDTFVNQFNNLHKWIEEDKETIHILAGDFNNPHGSLGYDHMIALGYRDLYKEANPDGLNDYTFIYRQTQGVIEGDNVNQRIDYVLTNDNRVECVNMKRLFTEKDYGMVSDHYGLIGVLDL